MDEIEQQLQAFRQQFPLVPFTNAGRLFSTVRRMQAERDRQIPLAHRTGFVVSVADGKRPSEMTGEEWERFFQSLCVQLQQQYPDLYRQLFPQH